MIYPSRPITPIVNPPMHELGQLAKWVAIILAIMLGGIFLALLASNAAYGLL